jgi:hypothetical protein
MGGGLRDIHECSAELDIRPLLSKTGANLAARVANGGFACPKLEFGV